MQMHTDTEACVRAVRTRDARFDGWFYTGVTSTGIYCRPSCPAMTPRTAHLRFYPTAAAAQSAGFRACKRCRPDATPGSPEWSVREDVVARAMRLVADGVVDSDGVEGLARRLGYSTRHLERLVVAELGAGPLALARAQRAQAARTLIETTRLPLADVAFAAGFASIRSFNDTVRAVFATTPSELRHRAGSPRQGSGAQSIRLRLPHRSPLHVPSLFGHLVATAVPGVERWDGTAFERSLRLPHAAGTVRLRPAEGYVEAVLTLLDLRDLTPAINRCRALLDLDSDPTSVDELLGADPLLAALVERAPGCRIPGTVDPAEMALRVVLGQQVSTRAAATTAGRLVLALGDPLPPSLAGPDGPTHLFPTPETLARLEDGDPRLPGMPSARRRTLLRLATALADGELDLGPGAGWAESRRQLATLPGIGPWTTELVAMRALRDPDAFPAKDLGVLRAAATVGLPATAVALEERARTWRPWRSYATQLLWASGGHEVARMPSSPVPAARHGADRGPDTLTEAS